MDNLKEAYQLIESIEPTSDLKTAKTIATKAYELSVDCIEAAIIIVRTSDNFSFKEKILLDSIDSLNKNTSDEQLTRNLNRAYYELGSLYFNYGMFKKTIEVFEPLVSKDLHYPLVYKLLISYAILEDERTETFYNERIKMVSDLEFVRLSFTLLIYLYKQNRMLEAKELLSKINKLNPMLLKVLKDEITKEEETLNETKEALRILRNNSILVNTCEYMIKELASLC